MGLWSLDYFTILNSLAILGPRNANPNPIPINFEKDVLKIIRHQSMRNIPICSPSHLLIS